MTSARSGTLYLQGLFQNNARDCVCRHEPFFDWGNPTMFGPAIYDAFVGRLDRIRARLNRKRKYISQLRTKVYFESSHAFLKSSYVAALEFFPDLRLIHLVRDPLKVAKSEAVRELRRRKALAPFHYYTGDDARRHFCWALTTNEEIYHHFELSRLSLFQIYLIQWIEIENRAMKFLSQHQLHDRCFTLDSPRDLNDSERMQELFDFLQLETLHPRILLNGCRNENIGHVTFVQPQEKDEAREILDKLPDRYLEIFQHEPYTRFGWNLQFMPDWIPPERTLQNALPENVS